MGSSKSLECWLDLNTKCGSYCFSGVHVHFHTVVHWLASKPWTLYSTGIQMKDFFIFRKIFWKCLKISVLKFLTSIPWCEIPSLSIYLKLMKKKEMGKWKAEVRQKLPTIISNFSYRAYITRHHSQSPILIFFLMRFGFFKVQNTCSWKLPVKF